MAIQKRDNVLDPNQKARFSFTMKDGQVVVGEQTVAETGGVDTVRTKPDDKEARKNGGGASSKTKASE